MISLLSFLSLFAAAIGYVTLNLLFVAWMRRRWAVWLRALRIFASRQLYSFTPARTGATIILQSVAALLLYAALSRPLEVIWFSTAVLSYVFVVSALTLSLLAQMPYFKRLWEDPFVKLTVLASPLLIGFVASGYASLWVGDILSIGASKAPMAHLAGTAFLLLVFVATILFFAAFAFQFFIMIVAAVSGSRTKSMQKRREAQAKGLKVLSVLFSPQRQRGTPEHLELRIASRAVGLMLMCAASFLGCILAFHVATLPTTHLGYGIISAVVFEFDAVPATRCQITKEENDLASGSEPFIKALMLSSSQDRAILIRRQPHLFSPVHFRERGDDPKRSLTALHVVRCSRALGE